jgi:hypothetical protein
MSQSIKDLLSVLDRRPTENALENPEVKPEESEFDESVEITDQYSKQFAVKNKGVRNGSGYAIERSNNFSDEMSFVTSNSSSNPADVLVHYGKVDPDDVETSQNVNRLQSYSKLNVGPRKNLASLLRDAEMASMDYRFNNTDLDGNVDDPTLLNHVNTNALVNINKHLSSNSFNIKQNNVNKTDLSRLSQFSALKSKPRHRTVFAVDNPPSSSDYSNYKAPGKYSKYSSAQDLGGE